MKEWVEFLAGVLPYWLENPSKGAAAGGAVVLVICAALLFVWSLSGMSPVVKASETSAGIGGVIMNNPTFNAPAQVGGQGNTQNNTFVNTAARYESQAQWGSEKDAEGYVTVVRFKIT